MMKTVYSIRRGLVSLVAACVVSAGATPANAEVLDGDVTFTTQAQVDAFADSGYTEVTGIVRIWDFDDGTNGEITNLDGLSSLTSVGGGLGIAGNDVLTDLDGLSSLTSVGVDLGIQNNAALTDVDGLSSLTSVGGNLTIYGNDSLTDVDGLSSLTSVGGFLTIQFNASLTDVDGLSSLTSVGGNLIISQNDSLSDACGLYPLLAADGLAGIYLVVNNPKKQDILDGGPCDPADTIGDLLAEGAITEGMATALLHLADNSLQGLSGLLTGFVQSRILTPSEAQLLFVIASNWQSAN